MKKRQPARKKANSAGPARKPAKANSHPRAARAAGVRAAEPQPDIEAIMHELAGGGAAPVRRRERWEQIECPYCGDNFEVHLDSVEDGQTLYEDCHMCCKPMSLHIEVEEDEVHVTVARS